MKKFFTLTWSLLTIGVVSLEAQQPNQDIYLKPEVRYESHSMELRENPFALRSGELTTRADSKPFPESTITYNLKGEPIAKEEYEYNRAGQRTSYRSYQKDGKTGEWIDNE